VILLEYKNASTNDLIDRLMNKQADLERLFTVASKYNLEAYSQDILNESVVAFVHHVSKSQCKLRST
jgi:hypothetical protein